MVRRRRAETRMPGLAFLFAPDDWAGLCLGEKFDAWMVARDRIWVELLSAPVREGAIEMIRAKSTARRLIHSHVRGCARCLAVSEERLKALAPKYPRGWGADVQ